MNERRMIERVLAAGLSVAQHDNSQGFGKPTEHYSIIGGARRVEFYPSTGMIFSNPVKDKFKQARIPRGNIDRAIKLAVTGK